MRNEVVIVFDFFRDMALELSGVDSEKAEREREEKRKIKKKNQFIFSAKSKIIIYAFGILYLVIGGINMTHLRGQERIAALILKFVFLSAVDIAGLICLTMRKRKTEIAALILIIIFVIVMYITTLLL